MILRGATVDKGVEFNLHVGEGTCSPTLGPVEKRRSCRIESREGPEGPKMQGKRYPEEQIIDILRERESEVTVAEVCRNGASIGGGRSAGAWTYRRRGGCGR